MGLLTVIVTAGAFVAFALNHYNEHQSNQESSDNVTYLIEIAGSGMGNGNEKRPLMSNGEVFCCKSTQTTSCGAVGC